ncbi:MAG: hypothetical protein AAB449_02560, partial [Patescibacteria group bacterium]
MTEFSDSAIAQMESRVKRAVFIERQRIAAGEERKKRKKPSPARRALSAVEEAIGYLVPDKPLPRLTGPPIAFHPYVPGTPAPDPMPGLRRKPASSADILRDIGAAVLHAGVRTDVNIAKLAKNLGLNTDQYIQETEELLESDPNLQARALTSGPGAQLFQAASESVGPSLLTGALAAPLGPLGMLAAPGLMFGG